MHEHVSMMLAKSQVERTPIPSKIGAHIFKATYLMPQIVKTIHSAWNPIPQYPISIRVIGYLVSFESFHSGEDRLILLSNNFTVNTMFVKSLIIWAFVLHSPGSWSLEHLKLWIGNFMVTTQLTKTDWEWFEPEIVKNVQSIWLTQ